MKKINEREGLLKVQGEEESAMQHLMLQGLGFLEKARLDSLHCIETYSWQSCLPTTPYATRATQPRGKVSLTRW
jgi:hypothetical protein